MVISDDNDEVLILQITSGSFLEGLGKEYIVHFMTTLVFQSYRSALIREAL